MHIFRYKSELNTGVFKYINTLTFPENYNKMYSLASRGEINIISIHKNIPYLLPNSVLLQSVLGPPDHEPIFNALLDSLQISRRTFLN